MDDLHSPYPRLSVCGLNCGLCPRYHTDGGSRCPGCCGEGFLTKRPACGVISCARRHGVDYCYQCAEYPCKKYDGVHLADSFITHRNMLDNFKKAGDIGIEAYQAELDEKVGILETLLLEYNDGRRKGFFCLAVNLLELEDVRQVMAQLAQEVGPAAAPKEKAAQASRLFEEMAEKRNITLKLNKK